MGAERCGIVPVWASEIEPFPIRVTTKHFPYMLHYGDVSTLDGAKLPPVDIITFGSPCQDMSIAGKRAGLCGSRSNLFYEAIRIIKEMRLKTNGIYPRIIVWENVNGAFSSNRGEDFRAVLEQICKIKDDSITISGFERWTNAGEILGTNFSVAWRQFDAKYWGVPQRRKRIYLVADFRGECAEKILFESKSLFRNSQQSKETGKGITTPPQNGIRAAGFDGYNGELTGNISATLGENCGLSSGRNGVVINDQGGERMDLTYGRTNTLRAEAHHPPIVLLEAKVFDNHGQDARYTEPLDKSPTVLSTYGTGGNNQPLVVETPVVYGICSKNSNSMKSNNPHSGIYKADTARTLDLNGGNPSCNQGGMAIVDIDKDEPIVCVQGSLIGRNDKNSPQGSGVSEGVSFTLNTIDRHAVAYTQKAYDKYEEDNLSCSLKASGGNYGGGSETIVCDRKYIVRRLTPTECGRLQGFPDGWCKNLETETPTEKDIAFWRDVFETHRKIVGNSNKPKTDKQIIKWLKNPYSDTAEYKMWGNGVALPNVEFVLSRIAKYIKGENL